jgi:hypothetical protein
LIYSRLYILKHGIGIASGCIAPEDTISGTIRGVYMVMTYRRCTYKPDTRTFKKSLAATGTRTDKKSVGILNVPTAYSHTGQSHHLHPLLLQSIFQIRNLLINYNLHNNIGLKYCKYSYI